MGVKDKGVILASITTAEIKLSLLLSISAMRGRSHAKRHPFIPMRRCVVVNYSHHPSDDWILGLRAITRLLLQRKQFTVPVNSRALALYNELKFKARRLES